MQPEIVQARAFNSEAALTAQAKAGSRGVGPETVRVLVQAGFGNPKQDRRIRIALAALLEDHSLSTGQETIRQLSSLLNISLSRFRHLFRKQTGFSPGHFSKLLRLCRAKDLMQSTFLSVKEVAATVGIRDLSHFVRDYHAVFQQSPSQSRRDEFGRQRKQTRAVGQQEQPTNSRFGQ